MKLYNYVLVFFRFTSIISGIYYLVCLANLYLNPNSLGTFINREFMAQAIHNAKINNLFMLVGSIGLFFIAPVLARLATMGLQRD